MIETNEVATPAPKRGGRPRKYATAAERQAAYRARKGETLTVQLDADIMAGLREYLERQHRDGDPSMTLSDVVARLVRTQLLRRR